MKIKKVSELKPEKVEKLKGTGHYARAKIKYLEKCLRDTDYKMFKFLDGRMSAEEYAPIKAERQRWVDEINELEKSQKFFDDVESCISEVDAELTKGG